MKKGVALIVAVLLLFSFCSCKEKTKTSDYQYMYDGIVKDWNRLTGPENAKESLLGFGEYLYNSELILFPKETPSTLKEFYFHWTPGIDVDGYAIYFTCELTEENYNNFSEGLENFKIINGENTLELYYDEDNFPRPTYILQWKDVNEKWEVLEYIMLDEDKHTAIFVYTMSELNYIEMKSSYIVTPNRFHFLEDDFSIYEDFENSTFDTSFLQYLE